VKPTNYTNYQQIATKAPGCLGGALFRDGTFQLRINQGTGFLDWDHEKSCGVNDIVDGSHAVPLNVWSMVGFVKSGTSLTLYVNSIAETKTLTSASSANSPFSVLIGHRRDGSQPGPAIDEALLFHRALSSFEVAAIYIDGRSSFEQNAPISPVIADSTSPPFADARYNGFGYGVIAPNGKLLSFFRNGTSHVSAGDYGVMMMMSSSNGGYSWSAPNQIYSESGIDIRNYAVGILSNGRIIVAFGRYNPDTSTFLSIDTFHSDDNGSTWSSPIAISIGGGLTYFSPSYGIISIGSGKMALFYYGNLGFTYQWRMQTSTDGVTWGGDTLVASSSVYNYTEPSAAYLGNNGILVLGSVDGKGNIPEFLSTNNGASWTHLSNFSASTCISCKASIISERHPTTGATYVVLYYAGGDSSSHPVFSSLISASDLSLYGTTYWSSLVTTTGVGDYIEIFHPLERARDLLISDVQFGGPTGGSRNLTFSAYNVPFPRLILPGTSSWSSPMQNVSLPVEVRIAFANQTASNRISRFLIESDSGVVIYESGPIGYFTTSPFVIDTSNLTLFPAIWKVVITMVGNGTSTSQIIGIAMTIGSPPTLDTNTWIFIFLLLAYVVLLIIAWYDDSVAWFIPAGIVMQLIAFQGWIATTSLPVAISLSVVGIVTLLVPIGHALRGKPS
jgi:hypothetical protein